MKFVEVKEIPSTGRANRGVLEERLEAFMALGIKYAKVVYDADDYTSPTSCRVAFARACRRYGFPVDAKMINGEVYLIRRDM
jgi:hypothetical protein